MEHYHIESTMALIAIRNRLAELVGGAKKPTARDLNDFQRWANYALLDTPMEVITEARLRLEKSAA